MQNKRFRLRNNFILNILFSFSSFVLALFGFLAVLPPASEPEVSAIIDGEQFALTITNSEAINLEINPTESGSIAVAKDTIVANTNSPAGYKLYVSTNSETSNNIHLNGRESNDTEDKKLVATTGTNEFPTALENNSWGFAIAGASNFDASYSTESPSTTSKFAAVPQKDAEQLIHDHTGRATDDETEIYFAAKADTNIASGNYQTTILYTTLSEATDQDQTEINLDKTVFLANYEEGDKTVTVNTSIMLSRTPNLIVKLNDIEIENVTITSIAPLSFVFDLPDGLASGKYDLSITLANLAKTYVKPGAIMVSKFMQDMTPDFCSALGLEEQIQLVDKRDNKTYWVAKLKDGNCWMTQNLDLNLSTTTTLTPEDSDVAENWTPSRATTTGTTSLNSTNWANNHNNPYSFDPGNYYFDGTYFNSSSCNYLTTTCSHFAKTPYNLNGEHGHVGNYYNWSAAVASNDTSATTVAGTDMNTSICPKGWRLPHGYQSAQGDDFATLTAAYGVTTSDSILIANPLFFVRGGSATTSSLANTGANSFYWSSTAYSATRAVSINAGSGSILPSGNYNRYAGFSVRCVARDYIHTLSYDANGGIGAPAKNVEENKNEYITLDISSTIPARHGYKFLGWAESADAETPVYVYDGIKFTPSNITFAEGKTLYAVWGLVTLSMQDVASWGDTLQEEQQVQAIDMRDGKIYWVSKLKDGNIWMTQNLDLDLSTETTLTPEDSDVTTNWTPSSTTITGAINNWKNDNNAPYSFDPGDYYSDGTYYDPVECRYTTETCEHFAQTPYDLNGEHGHVGNYYNWSAAVASNDTSMVKTMGVDAETSICPKGWRLPHGYQSTKGNDFETLNIAYDGTVNSGSIFLANPLFFVVGGYLNLDHLSHPSFYGYYWSSTVSSSENANDFYFRSTAIHTSNDRNRYYGYSIRCVARGKDLSMISTMQEMTPEVVSNTNENESKQLTDTRDGKTYWVTKLKDGNIWMTQNLDYDLSVAANQTLTPATSNVTENRIVTPVTWGADNNSIYYMDGGDNYFANGTTQTAGLASLPEDSVDRHYAQGDYYSWKAATAGVGTTSITNTDVNESICPSGWRLPTSNSVGANYSFGNLVKQYGYTGSDQSGTTDATLLASPLFFARGGHHQGDQGRYGRYWSSRADSSSNNYAYSLNFYSGGVGPSSGNNRLYGFSVRCLAR